MRSSFRNYREIQLAVLIMVRTVGIGYRRWAPRGVERASFGLGIVHKRPGNSPERSYSRAFRYARRFRIPW
jgi:hypothetical protein